MTKKATKKTSKKPVPKPAPSAPAAAKAPEHDNPAGVDALIQAMDHPLASVVQAVRAAILSADKTITEGIKWNSPSFYCEGWFATVNVRGKQALVILHHGAKVRDGTDLGATLKDPDNLLKWLGKDRASVGFASDADFEANRKAFTSIIRQWAKYQREIAAA